MSRARLGLCLAILAGGCSGSSPAAPARAQVVLHVDTDAPVAHAGADGAPGWGDALPLFDRLHVDLYAPGSTTPCDGCSNEFTVSYEDFAADAVSFGLVPGQGEAGWVARVRLTLERFELSTGDIDPDASVEAWVALPAVVDGQVTDVTLFLSTDATGVATGSLDAPIDPTPGAPAGSAVGTWPGAQRADCSTAAPSAAVCVPGGAFWMGATTDALVPGASRTWRRLVVLSPFWLDATEMTAGRARKLGIPTTQLTAWSGGNDGTDEADYCTFSPTPTARDVLPLDCVSWRGALQVCQKQGAALPTEAQIEYAAGGAFGRPYPWGEDPAACEDAVWGRDGYGAYASNLPTTCYGPKNFLAPLGGPEAPGWGARDVMALPGGNVSDLSGNLFEITGDSYQLHDDPCWSPHGVLRDPLCTLPSTAGSNSRAIRGGSWTVGGSYLEAQHREVLDDLVGTPDIGFRCAWKGASQ